MFGCRENEKKNGEQTLPQQFFFVFVCFLGNQLSSQSSVLEIFWVMVMDECFFFNELFLCLFCNSWRLLIGYLDGYVQWKK